MKKRVRVTVIDVAKKAGVSQTTVSRVLNDHPQIKESTKTKVLQAIDELGFSPNQIARSMVMKKTRTIGWIVGEIDNPYYAESAKVIMGKARQINYDVIITDTENNYDYFEKSIKTMVDKGVDGILISTLHHKESMVNELFESGFPIVYFNRKPDRDGIHSVTVDNEKGIYLAVQHLVELGHENIAFVSYPSRFPTLHERYLGYLDALKKFGLRIDETLVHNREFSHENIFKFVSDTLSREDRPTSFITSIDQLAISVMDAVSKSGLSASKKVSIIGFGDIDIASHPYIGLTTVSSQKREMAQIALEKLISLIERKLDPQSPVQVILEPELIIRKTTASARILKRKKGGVNAY